MFEIGDGVKECFLDTMSPVLYSSIYKMYKEEECDEMKFTLTDIFCGKQPSEEVITELIIKIYNRIRTREHELINHPVYSAESLTILQCQELRSQLHVLVNMYTSLRTQIKDLGEYYIDLDKNDEVTTLYYTISCLIGKYEGQYLCLDEFLESVSCEGLELVQKENKTDK